MHAWCSFEQQHEFVSIYFFLRNHNTPVQPVIWHTIWLFLAVGGYMASVIQQPTSIMLVSNAGATIPGQNVPFRCFNGRDADVADVLGISADSLSFAARQFFKQATWNLKSRASPKPSNELRGFPIAFRKADWQNHTRSSCANSSGYGFLHLWRLRNVSKAGYHTSTELLPAPPRRKTGFIANK